ncbi:MAG: RNA-directed DNA polymerase [Sandaracinaceae bacterium]|nr:RNA-directed DNA polymerase [Sandaracinaceae bacterium]
MEIAPYVDGWVEAGLLDKHGYTGTEQIVAGRAVWIYHRVGQPVAGVTPSTRVNAPAPTAPKAAPQKAKKKEKKKRKWFDPWDAGDLMSLTAAELRARAMKIVPWRTAWIGRVDVIPPQSDERTALVDRGLILRGFFTEEQIEEIHRIGDLWLKHKDAAKLARAAAAKSADAAILQLREEAKQKKARLKEEAKARAEKQRADVAHRKATDIVYLGRGVSGQLHDRRSNIERLESQGLPLLAAPADVADALGVTVSRLRWLAFHDEAAPAGHYSFFEIPKRSGGTRLLSAPKAELRAAQSWIHENILKKVALEAPAHGFVPGRSTVTNAAPHVGRDVVVNLDLEDFFPTITFARVRGLFTSLGYSPAVATVLALLTTEAPRRRLTYAGRPYFVAVGRRGLPQGACTSPALSNLVARKLDRRMAGLAKKLGWTYTRYADDLTFSAPAGQRDTVGRLFAHVRHIVQDEGFRVNEKKGRVQRKGGRQTVTGVVVNERLAVPREEVRRLRAILNNAKKTGLAAQNRDDHPHFEAWLRGKIAYVSMVDPDRGAKLAAQLAELS